MLVPIAAFYASLLALIFVFLVFYVGSKRNATDVAILDGGDVEPAERIRRHANFAENVPIPLVLLFALELNGASALLLHALGTVLVLARIAHPFGIDHQKLRHPLRGLGSLATLGVTLVAAGVAFWQFAVR